jgi:hypothetical protein
MELDPSVKKIVIDNKLPAYGMASSDGTITLNLKKGDVLDTIIHENLHMKDWGMPHSKIYPETDRIEGNMSLREAGETFLKAHDRMLNPIRTREYVRTVASKVVSSSVKQ